MHTSGIGRCGGLQWQPSRLRPFTLLPSHSSHFFATAKLKSLPMKSIKIVDSIRRQRQRAATLGIGSMLLTAVVIAYSVLQAT